MSFWKPGEPRPNKYSEDNDSEKDDDVSYQPDSATKKLSSNILGLKFMKNKKQLDTDTSGQDLNSGWKLSSLPKNVKSDGIIILESTDNPSSNYLGRRSFKDFNPKIQAAWLAHAKLKKFNIKVEKREKFSSDDLEMLERYERLIGLPTNKKPKLSKSKNKVQINNSSKQKLNDPNSDEEDKEFAADYQSCSESDVELQNINEK